MTQTRETNGGTHTEINRIRKPESTQELDNGGIRFAPAKQRRLDLLLGNATSCDGNNGDGLRDSRARTVDHHVVDQDVRGGRGVMSRNVGVGSARDVRPLGKPNSFERGTGNNIDFAAVRNQTVHAFVRKKFTSDLEKVGLLSSGATNTLA